jgi:hypothetical protein
LKLSCRIVSSVSSPCLGFLVADGEAKAKLWCVGIRTLRRKPQVIKLGKTSRANKLLVGYVGGTEDEEEWVEISRVRTPQEDVRQVLAGKGGMR